MQLINYLFIDKHYKLCHCIQGTKEGAYCCSRRCSVYIFLEGVLDEAEKAKKDAMVILIQLDEKMVDIKCPIDLVEVNLWALKLKKETITLDNDSDNERDAPQ